MLARQQLTYRRRYCCLEHWPNSCDYLAQKLTAGSSLSTHAVCMGDDDNDIEMALACRHALVPTVASQTMAETIRQFPDKFTAIREEDTQGTLATERALDELLQMLKAENVRP